MTDLSADQIEQAARALWDAKGTGRSWEEAVPFGQADMRRFVGAAAPFLRADLEAEVDRLSKRSGYVAGFDDGTHEVMEVRDEVERLRAEMCGCEACGHYQAEPNWCHECGHRVRMPEWAEKLLAERDGYKADRDQERHAHVQAEQVRTNLILDQDRQIAELRAEVEEYASAAGAEAEAHDGARKTARFWAEKTKTAEAEVERLRDRNADLERVVDDLSTEGERLREVLRQCARLSGADLSDGFPTWPALPDFAVEAVKQLRADYDECPAPEDLAEAEKRICVFKAALASANTSLRFVRSEVERLKVEAMADEVTEANLRRWLDDARAEVERLRLQFGELCPNAEVCNTCPCSLGDDACFPGERLRAKRDEARRTAEFCIGQLEGLRAERDAIERQTIEKIVAWITASHAATGCYPSVTALRHKFLQPTGPGPLTDPASLGGLFESDQEADELNRQRPTGPEAK